jgi:glycosyltransferase involved in cell wall biosynthesis
MLHERVDLVAISEAQKRLNTDVRYAGVVHNGIDLDAYPLQEEKGDYLMFLGRSSPEKGPDLAVEVAKRAGMPLKMAVKIAEPAERQYWDEQVVPRMTGEEEVVRNASHDRKVALLRGARATLFPIQWDEPFGLVMVESMACGTPILSFPRGAALEIVDDGVNGYLVDDVDAMAEAVGQVAGVKPDTCRRSVEERFSARTMIEGYRDVFDRAMRV